MARFRDLREGVRLRGSVPLEELVRSQEETQDQDGGRLVGSALKDIGTCASCGRAFIEDSLIRAACKICEEAICSKCADDRCFLCNACVCDFLCSEIFRDKKICNRHGFWRKLIFNLTGKR